jgi:hypothetical protein
MRILPFFIPVAIGLKSIYDHTSFLLPNEVKPPTYVNDVSPGGDLTQEGYDQQILSNTSRDQLVKFQENLDAFGERLGENTFGRAHLVETRPYQLNTCCYPDTAILPGPIPKVGAPARLTATPIYIVK